MIESIRKVGTINPALARPLPDGGYELISGHRRLAACQVLGFETMPVIVREMSDDEAVIAMVDANLQRETILPSEKAFAYKMKLDAIKHQGKTSVQVAEKLLSVEKVAEEAGESKDQVRRYIRLTYLIPELLSMVDDNKIAFNPAVEISYLDRDELNGGDATINPHFDLCSKEITLVGSWVYTLRDYATTFDFLKRAIAIGLPIKELITHRFPLEEMNEALETNLAQKGLKIAYVRKDLI